jgi:transposase
MVIRLWPVMIELITKAVSMGLSIRIFLVNEDDTLRRLAINRFNRLFSRDTDERLPEYAGKRLRYALIVIELENRKPVGILRTEFSYFAFDSQGRLREDEREKATRLSMDMIKPIEFEHNNDGVIDARHKFAKKRFEHEYTWQPTPELEAAIFKAVLGRGQSMD